MDIDKLRYFQVIERTASIRKAADFLGMSPAGLSKSLKTLEDHIGCKLVEPDGRGIRITAAGKRLALELDRVMSTLSHLPKLVRGEESQHHWLRIGAFEVFSTYFLGNMLEEYFPDRPTLINEYIPGELESALIDGRIDLGITYIPVPHTTLDHWPVVKIKMAVYGRADAFSGKPFASLPFAVPISRLSETVPTKVQGLDGWPDHKIMRQVKYRVLLMESALELCRKGLAVAYLPQFVVDLHNRYMQSPYRLVELPNPMTNKEERTRVYVVKRKSDPEDQTVKRVARALRLITATTEREG